MKPGTEVTITFLPELPPTAEARAVALEVFERQAGTKPTSYLEDADTGVWGFLSPDAALLFRFPAAVQEPVP